jgi:hypothetical protein
MDDVVESLVREILNVDPLEFWWNSKLLKLCESHKEIMVVAALLTRHHFLQNKDADSCHVIRNTIKIIDGPNLNFLWHIINSEEDPEKIITEEEDPNSLLWASAYVLGEIGGMHALNTITEKLQSQNIGKQYLFIRITMHLLGRYKLINSSPDPMVQVIDTKTGDMQSKPLKDYPDQYERYLIREKQENEYFVPVDKRIIPILYQNINLLDDRVFPVVKQDLLECVEQLPT